MLTLLTFLLHSAEAAVPVGEYDAVRSALSLDDVSAAQSAAAILVNDPTIDPSMAAPARVLAEATDLAGMRTAFAELSRVTLLALGEKPAEKVFVYHCPMAPGYGYWFQAKPGLVNPFFGQAMASCGEGVTLKVAQKAATGGLK